jgi:hypothetical protein
MPRGDFWGFWTPRGLQVSTTALARAALAAAAVLPHNSRISDGDYEWRPRLVEPRRGIQEHASGNKYTQEVDSGKELQERCDPEHYRVSPQCSSDPRFRILQDLDVISLAWGLYRS